tara:strand:- start:362 stop:643 length:282 start_codon:yes stop_codon:yes gene_type:complete
MLNSPIDTSEKDAAIERKWLELEKSGQAIFQSDDENRYINRDEIMADVIADLGSFGLHYDMTVAPLGFSSRVLKLYDIAINSAMKEAIEDFYK